MKHDCTTGFRNMAARIEHAETSFIATLMTMGDIDKGEAERVSSYYRKHKPVVRDAVNGTVNVKNGAFLDRDIIRRAVNA